MLPLTVTKIIKIDLFLITYRIWYQSKINKYIRMSSKVVFKCAHCFISVIRDSPEHNECVTVDGINWYCGDCCEQCPEEDTCE